MLAFTTQLVRHTPPWLVEDSVPVEGAPVYLVKPLSVVERALFEGELAGPPYNAGEVNPLRRMLTIRQGIDALLTGDDRGAALEAVSNEASRTGGEPDQIYRDVIAGLGELYPPYAELARQSARREACARALAAMRCLKGWEGLETPFEAGSDGCPTDATLKAMDPDHLAAVGYFAFQLMYGREHRPTSPPPPTSGDGGKTSTSASKSRAADGGSRTRSGRRTRAT